VVAFQVDAALKERPQATLVSGGWRGPSQGREPFPWPPEGVLLLEATLSLDAAELEHFVDHATRRLVTLRELFG
jgi:hypothetical protein